MFGKPDFFHIGLEEESYEAQKNNYIAVVRCPKKKTEDTKLLIDTIMSRGVRPAIWMDEVTLENFGGEQYFADNMPKDVLLTTWGYGSIREVEKVEDACSHAQFIKRLVDLGYDVMPATSTWSWHLNTKETMKFCKKFVDVPNLVGFMTASWMLTTENKFFALVNDAYTFYTAYRDVFGTLPKTDRKPWELL